MITIYTKPDCSQCTATKKRFKQKNIEYSEVDITVDPSKIDELYSAGFRNLPIIVADNDKWSGYRPDLIDKLHS